MKCSVKDRGGEMQSKNEEKLIIRLPVNVDVLNIKT